MASFNSFLDILPDPDVKIGDAGELNEAGTAGQGFATVKLSRNTETERDRTIGGRVINRRAKYPMWKVDLTYNELTKDQFAPIYAFISEKQTGLRPFFVELPQYKEPKDSNFATFVSGTNHLYTTAAHNAGVTSIEVDLPASGLPMFGDLFHIEDSNDSFHTKTYMVDRVIENTSSMTLYFSPALHRATSSGAEVVFYRPKMFVRQTGNVQEYNLNNNNLYTFSLKLEEVSY